MAGRIYASDRQRRVLRVFPDLIRSRELLLDLIAKDLRIRYRYALMGFLWAVIEPLLMMVILYFVFGIVFNMRAGASTPSMYAVSLLTGLVFWQFLSRTLSGAAHSIVDSGNLVSKVYFPREVIPLSVVGVGVVNLLIGFAILLGFFFVVGGRPGIQAIWLPALFGIELALVVGLALLLSCLNAFFRDVSYIVDIGLALAFYATPIFYDFRDVVARLSDNPVLYHLYTLNPMVGLITMYRQVLLENQPPSPEMLLIPGVEAAIALFLGIVVFRRSAGTVADYL
jgi:lipopolysaccharide transport system permease protein